MKRFLCLIVAMFAVFNLTSCKKEEEAVAKEEKASAGSITLYSLKDDTLCPILTDNEANRQMLGIVYESLVSLENNMEPKAKLAKSWSVSSDGLIWTFELRNDVKWHNGDSLKAEDVVYTINQIKQAEQSCYFYNVKRIAEVSEAGNSVVMTLSEPCPTFVNLMTFPVIKKGDDEIDRNSFSPCGTGAYVFSGGNSGNIYTLKRNENWWGGKAKLDEIKVKLLPDSETVAYSFSSGDIDVANSEWGQSNLSGGADMRTTSCPLTVYDFIGVNHNNSVLKNKEVRKAISLAVKREKIINDIFAGNAVKANSPLRENWVMSGDKEDYEVDNTEAENLLLKNGWKKDDGIYSRKTEDGRQKLDFEIIVNQENSSRVNIAESIKSDLDSIGMSVKVIPLSFEDYENRIATGDYQLFVGSTMISEEIDLSFLLGSGNMFAFEDEKMNEILFDIKHSANKETLVENYGKLKKRFISQVPIIGICFENFCMLYSKKVEGELSPTPANIYSGIHNLYTRK